MDYASGQLVRVIGVPRSGTNLAKYLLETHTTLRCVFNHGWWKHAVIPPLFASGEPLPDTTPTIVLFREPVAQMLAFFRFSEKGRSAIYGDSPLDAFLRHPVRTDPPGGYSYRFASPMAYWEQFYDAALRWDTGTRFFVSLEAVQARPALLLDIARAIDPNCVRDEEIALPEAYLGRNGDAHVSQSFGFEGDRATEEADAAVVAAGCSGADRELILGETVRQLYEELLQASFSGARTPTA
jgi:hypothetical protein